MARWSMTPVIDWLLHKGRHLATRRRWWGNSANGCAPPACRSTGSRSFSGTLHPQYFGVALYWDGEKVRIRPRRSTISGETEEVPQQPRRRASRRANASSGAASSGRTARSTIPVLRGTARRGHHRLRDRRGACSATARAIRSASRRAGPGGFTDHDIVEVERLLHPFALAMENFAGRDLCAHAARNLPRAHLGSRVLDGPDQARRRPEHRRGDLVLRPARIDAAVGGARRAALSRAAERLLPRHGRRRAGARRRSPALHRRRLARGVPDHRPGRARGLRARRRRRRAPRERAVHAANAARRAAGLPGFACGIGLHLGRVYYGNIGTPERLEFSVIGAAANKAARIEALCKETGQDVVLSSAFAAELGAPLPQPGQVRAARRRGARGSIRAFLIPTCWSRPPCGAAGRWSWPGGRRGSGPARWRHPGCCGSR